MRISVIDLGATSFGHIHARVAPGGRLAVIERRHQVVGLADGALTGGSISGSAWNRGLAAAQALGERMRIGGGRRIAVATSGLREVPNGRAFAAEVGARLGAAVDILEPEQEAALAYAGARTEIADGGRALVVDVGGGSVGLAVGDGPEPIYAASVPLGVLRLRDALGVRHPLPADDGAALVRLLTLVAGPVAAAIKRLAPQTVIFGSETSRSLAALARAHGLVDPSCRRFDRATFRRLSIRVLHASREHLLRYDVAPARIDTIAIAALVCETLLALCDCDEAIITAAGVLEGAAVRAARRFAVGGGEAGGGDAAADGNDDMGDRLNAVASR